MKEADLDAPHAPMEADPLNPIAQLALHGWITLERSRELALRAAQE